MDVLRESTMASIMLRRSRLTWIGAAIAGIGAYYGCGLMLSFVIFNILNISVSSANRSSIVFLILLKVIPALCAAIVSTLVVIRARGGARVRGFDVSAANQTTLRGDSGKKNGTG